LKDSPAAWYMISLMRLNSRSLNETVDTQGFLNTKVSAFKNVRKPMI
jgi:hypothetical protein